MFGHTGASLKISIKTWLPGTTALILLFCSANSLAQQDVGEVAFANSDPITASAPFERVDLVAVGRPRLGGKEPSNDNYRLRFSHALSADRDDGYRDR